MNYINRMKSVLYLLPLICLLIVSCKVSDSDGDPSGNPVGVAIVDIDAALFGNACQSGSIVVNTEAVPDGTEIEFGENSQFICLVGPDVVVDSDGVATAGVITDYFVGPGQVFEIPLTIQLLLDDGTTFDQFSTVEIIGIGFIPPEGSEEGFDVEAPAADAMDPSQPIPFIFDQIGLITPPCDPIMITVIESNDTIGTAEAFIQPDGTILVEYTPVNGTEGVNIITISTQLTVDPAIQAACPMGTVSDGVTVTSSITINQTAADPEMVTPEDCTNAIDDDGDGDVSCADSDCMGMAPCEATEMTCDDNIDNDGNGMTDCDDPNCQMGGDGSGADICFEVTCDDTMDNDTETPLAPDGADCEDMDCDGLDGEPGAGTAVCQVGGPETICDDGFDNDANGMDDCDDPNCQIGGDGSGADICFEVTCDDTMDNDTEAPGAPDGADCEDEDCDGVGICEFGAELTCDDGMDNDGDGNTDCADTMDCPDTTPCEGGGMCNAGVCDPP